MCSGVAGWVAYQGMIITLNAVTAAVAPLFCPPGWTDRPANQDMNNAFNIAWV